MRCKHCNADALPNRERMAEILYTAAHKGLRNCWKWSSPELDHEHPTSRGYWYKIADGTLAALTSTERCPTCNMTDAGYSVYVEGERQP